MDHEMNARTDGADSVNDPRSGNEIMAEAFEAFDKWRSEHDPEGDMDVIEAAKIYAFWCDSPNREWQCAGCQAYNNPDNIFCWHCNLPMTG